MVVLLLFAALSVIFVLILLHPLKLKKAASVCPPPGPKGLPIIGNLHQFDPSKPYLYLTNLGKIYGPIFSLRLGSKPYVVVQSAKIAKEVLQAQDLNFCTRPLLVGSQRLSYQGLDITFNPYNNEYAREIRKLCVVNLFSSKKVQSFAPIRRDEVSKMIHQIASLSSASQIVDLSELLMNFACSNISRIAFGKRYGYGEGEETERRRFYRLLNEAEALLTTFFFSDYLPSVGWLDKLTGQSSRLERAFKELDAFYEDVIQDHLDSTNRKAEQDDDGFVDILLRLMKDRSFTIDLTLDNIKGVLMDMIVAGTNTSAIMVIWAMAELVKHPDSMKKVQDELRNAMGNKGQVSQDDLAKCEFFKAVVKETFRIHPAVPLLIVREARQKCTLEGYEIVPKTRVLVNVWAIGRDPERWEDPSTFKPERFLGSSVDFRGKDFDLIPFGAGRRMCPGMLLGIAGTELALASLLYWFDWELPLGVRKEDIDTDTLPGVAMHKKNPLCLVATNKFFGAI